MGSPTPVMRALGKPLLCAGFPSNLMMLVSSLQPTGVATELENGLVTQHAYTVTGAEQVRPHRTLNPLNGGAAPLRLHPTRLCLCQKSQLHPHTTPQAYPAVLRKLTWWLVPDLGVTFFL